MNRVYFRNDGINIKPMPDIETTEFIKPFAEFDPGKATAQINRFQENAIKRADSIIGWYKKAKKAKGRASRAIRALCIVFFAAIIIAPFCDFGDDKSKTFLKLGYICAAVGSGLLFFDRFYGFSTGWVRTDVTLGVLQDARVNFERLYQSAMLLQPPVNADAYNALLAIIGNFDTTVSTVVNTETKQWADEFATGNKELGEVFKSSQQTQKPGDIQVTIENYTQYTAIRLFLNDKDIGPIVGGTRLISSVPPDMYSILVNFTTADGKVVQKSSVAEVKNGVLTTVSMKYP
jgi:SMODS and SLOG-associating 2TM effector domain 2